MSPPGLNLYFKLNNSEPANHGHGELPMAALGMCATKFTPVAVEPGMPLALAFKFKLAAALPLSESAALTAFLYRLSLSLPVLVILSES